MKRLSFLILTVFMASCSSRPDSAVTTQWKTALRAKKEALRETDTAFVKQLVEETDAQLANFRSRQFHDTLSLSEGQLIDSTLVEKNFLQLSLVNLDRTVQQLDIELEELSALKRTIDKQAGTVSERNKLLSAVRKDVLALNNHAAELLAAISLNRQLLSRHLEGIGEITGKYFPEAK